MAGLTVIFQLILLSVSSSFAWNNFRNIQGFGGVPLLRLQSFRRGVLPPFAHSRSDETEALVLSSEPKMLPERVSKKREIVVSAGDGWMPDPVRFNIIPAVPNKDGGGGEVFMIPEMSDLYARFMPIEAVPTSDRTPSEPEAAARPEVPEVAATRPRPEMREEIPFLLREEESRTEELSRIPKEAAFRTVAIGHGGVNHQRITARPDNRRQPPVSTNRRQPITATGRRTTASSPVAVARGPPLLGRTTLPQQPPSPAIPTATSSNAVGNTIEPVKATSRALRKAFKRCHGKCVQKRCLPIGDLGVYEKCVLECTKVCE